MRFDQLVDTRKLGGGCGRLNLEFKVLPARAAVKTFQLYTNFFIEVGKDVGLYVRLGGGSEAKHGRHHALASLFLDEASDVAIVGAKVMSPLGDAVRLVQHPGTNLALRQYLPQRLIAQLFRRDNEDADVAQTYTIQHVGALRHRKHAVQCRADPIMF